MNERRLPTWETHLIRNAVAGDRAAFELLADLHRPVLRSLALRQLRNPDDANDAVQEALLKAYRAIGGFDPARPVKPWLCRILANCCVDTVRDRRRGTEPLDDYENLLVDESRRTDDEAEDALRSHEVVAAVDRLPERYREIVVMRHFRHMDVVEIADALDKPEGTIKSWLFRARAMLRQDLQVRLA